MNKGVGEGEIEEGGQERPTNLALQRKLPLHIEELLLLLPGSLLLRAKERTGYLAISGPQVLSWGS